MNPKRLSPWCGLVLIIAATVGVAHRAVHAAQNATPAESTVTIRTPADGSSAGREGGRQGHRAAEERRLPLAACSACGL